MLGVLVITLWTVATTGLMFGVLKKTEMLRVSVHDELNGLDESKHGGDMYASFARQREEAASAPPLQVFEN